MFNQNITNLAYIFQLLMSGIVSGSLYALIALALVIVFKTTRTLNLAVGEMGAVGAFVAISALSLGLGVWVAILLALIASFVLGAVVERTLIRPAEARGQFAVVLVTLALFLILSALIGLIWGTDVLPAVNPLPHDNDSRIQILVGPPIFSISYTAIGIVAVLAVVAAGLWLVLSRTRLGLAYRAVVDNTQSSSLAGIPVHRIFLLGWGVSGIVGALAAILIAANTGTLDYTLLGIYLIYGLAAATLGGFESIPGAVVGGLAVGLLVNTLPGLVGFVPSDMGLVVALFVILFVLLVRPQGLFGRARLERV